MVLIFNTKQKQKLSTRSRQLLHNQLEGLDESSRSGSPRRGQHLSGAAWGIGGAAPAPSQCGTAGWIPGAAGAANPAAGARHVWRGGGAGEKAAGREAPSP